MMHATTFRNEIKYAIEMVSVTPGCNVFRYIMASGGYGYTYVYKNFVPDNDGKKIILPKETILFDTYDEAQAAIINDFKKYRCHFGVIEVAIEHINHEWEALYKLKDEVEMKIQASSYAMLMAVVLKLDASKLEYLKIGRHEPEIKLIYQEYATMEYRT